MGESVERLVVPLKECSRILKVFYTINYGMYRTVLHIYEWLKDDKIIPLYYMEEFRRQILLCQRETSNDLTYTTCTNTIALLDRAIIEVKTSSKKRKYKK